MSEDFASKPATPRRITPLQTLSGLFRTPTRLHTPTVAAGRRNKRTRSQTSSTSSVQSTPGTPSLPAVVLQTYSVSTDSVVLTTLPSAPFCCHEDLLTMSRAQLEGVVRTLNMRLPHRMRIGPEVDFWKNDAQDQIGRCDDEDDDGLSRMSEAEMKRRIEELVGIRAVVGKNRVSRLGLGLDSRTGAPPTPKAVRTRDAAWRPYEKTPWEMEVDEAEDQTDDLSSMIQEVLMGSSPLAGRTKSSQHSRGRNSALSHLPVLQEENEGSDSIGNSSDDSKGRPSKRQRVSLGSVTRYSEEESEIIPEIRTSRLIEDMDVSGSSLLSKEHDALSDKFSESDERMLTTTRNPGVDTNTSEDTAQVPLQRRRSARIREIALKRVSSIDMEKATRGATNLKSSILRSNSRRSSKNNQGLEEPGVMTNPKTPREVSIRLPFTSTPPHQKADSPTWSMPRILRSHSQRLPNSNQSFKTKSSLVRSRSEKYPRPSDMGFVTVNRPKYRLTERNSTGSKVVKGNREVRPSTSVLPSPSVGQPRHGVQLVSEYEKENNDPKAVSESSSTSGTHPGTRPSTLYGFFPSYSRTPSTSTVASTRSNCGDSPVRATAREGSAPTLNTSLSNNGTEQVWEALGRMAVDSVREI